MPRPSLVAASASLLCIVLAALVFLGGQVPMCLGPLGVTAVQCWAATGRVPEIGAALPLCAVSLAIWSVWLAPIPAPGRAAALLGALIGGVIGAAAYAALRPRTIEGPGSTGAWYVVQLPLDLAGVAASAIAGAAVGGHAMGHLTGAIRRRRAP